MAKRALINRAYHRVAGGSHKLIYRQVKGRAASGQKGNFGQDVLADAVNGLRTRRSGSGPDAGDLGGAVLTFPVFETGDGGLVSDATDEHLVAFRTVRALERVHRDVADIRELDAGFDSGFPRHFECLDRGTR